MGFYCKLISNLMNRFNQQTFSRVEYCLPLKLPVSLYTLRLARSRSAQAVGVARGARAFWPGSQKKSKRE